MSLLMERQIAGFGSPKAGPTSVSEVFNAVGHFECFYPDFEGWFWDQVVPGLQNGTRQIRTVVRDGRLSGLTILKNADERKICTLWVADRYVGTGMGIRLLKDGVNALGGKPLATVPEERIAVLGPALTGIGFELTEVVDSAYRSGKREYVFNGYLRQQVS